MSLQTASAVSECAQNSSVRDRDAEEQVAVAVRAGLGSRPRRLPPWLFYDEAGSRLFDAITELPEYYLTRTERSILLHASEEIVERASEGRRLRIA